MNKVFLVGNLGNDPEGTSLSGGSYVVKVNLATTRRWKDKRGEKQEETSWHRLVVWGSLAEIFEQYLTKGAKISVVGRIQYRTWDDKDGKKMYGTDIVVEEMEMLGGGEDRSDDRGRGKDRGRSRDRGRNEERGRDRDRGGRDRQRNDGRRTSRDRDFEDDRSSRARREDPDDNLRPEPEEDDIPF